MRSIEQKLERRLSGYWKMEAANVVIIPLVAFLAAKQDEAVEIGAMAVVYAGVALLLVVGAAYWRGVLKRRRGETQPLERALRLADVAERPALILIVLAAIANIALMLGGSFAGPEIACLGGLLLLILEYVNYYRVQLQHFDHAADLKRLLSGKGFRRAHMARDLAAYRARRR
jgi:TRAP-type C4-dicarboxylate transport system permease large subunit